MSAKQRTASTEARIALGVGRCKARAMDVMERLLEGTDEDAGKLWREATVRTRAAFTVAGAVFAKERVDKQVDAGPRRLGVVVVTAKIDERREWEAMAAATERKAIAATVVDAVEGPEVVESSPPEEVKT